MPFSTCVTCLSLVTCVLLTCWTQRICLIVAQNSLCDPTSQGTAFTGGGHPRRALWEDRASPGRLPSLCRSCAMLPSELAPSAPLARREEWRAWQESALEEARGRLRSLQEDFVYNLQVLEERDRELERYDAAFARVRGLEEAWQAEVSQLKVEVARLRQALARETERREDLQRQHQRELREHRLALESARR